MEKFNLFVGLLFGRLYEEFPTSLRIAPEQFVCQIVAESGQDDSFKFIDYFENTVKWLERAGYIWITQNYSDDRCTEFDVVLSEKGLDVECRMIR